MQRSLEGYGGHSGGATPVPIRTRKLSPPAISLVLRCASSREGEDAASPLIIIEDFRRWLNPIISGCCPGSVDRPIMQDCHSCDSGSNPDQGVSRIIENMKIPPEKRGSPVMTSLSYSKVASSFYKYLFRSSRGFLSSSAGCVWARSSVWLEHRPFKPGVAGSNPVGPAKCSGRIDY